MLNICIKNYIVSDLYMGYAGWNLGPSNIEGHPVPQKKKRYIIFYFISRNVYKSKAYLG